MKGYALESAVSKRVLLGDYLFLAKPGIVSLVLMSTLTGLCIGSRGLPDAGLTLWIMLGVGLTTAGSALLNNFFDRDIDCLMERTRARTLALEAVSPGNAATLGSLLTGSGILILGVAVNLPSAILTAVAALGYVFLYTILLKRRTPFANQVGGIAGALPPLIGYAAVTQHIDAMGMILFGIVAVWQQPHALSIALKYKEEYRKACIPVVPVAKGVRSTKIRIVIYTALLLPAGILPYVYGMAGIFYAGVSVALGIFYLFIAGRFMRSKRECDMSLFFYSLVYITMIFAAMILNMTN
ncbi:MAG TPA: heme o synthase [Nitrospirota bacterium]|nr:heme o synthase [Nitrospirota bacterium]